MRLLMLSVFSALVVLGAPHSGTATTWHVPGEAPTIQAGIDSAAAGDTVLVACGTYYEHDIEMWSGITLRSELGEPDCVTIDAQGLGSGIRCRGDVGLVRIEGFTITGGEAAGGGGVNGGGAAVSLANCHIVDNHAEAWGGGGYFEGTLYIEECLFSDNRSDVWALTLGGGVYSGGQTEIVDTIFRNNTSTWGGGLYLDVWTDAVIDGCTFVENTAERGGGFDCAVGAVEVTNTTFWKNFAYVGGGASESSIDYLTTMTFRNCTFVENRSGAGAGLFYRWAEVTLENTIIAFGVGDGGSIWSQDGYEPTLTCCDIYGNEGGNWWEPFEGQLGLDGNISVDPLFCDPDNGDFTLEGHSPCLPGEHPGGHDCGLIGVFAHGCGDPTAVVPSTWGGIKSLYR